MVQQCAGCQLPIADKFLLKVLDRVWHVNCVKCCECKCTLSEKCFSREGRLFCRKDFYRRYGTKCAGCTQGISPNDMVRRARNYVFHVDCFICSVCKRQIATGDELYYIGNCTFICKEDFYHTNFSHAESEKDLAFRLDDDLEAALGGKRRGPRTTIKAKQLEALKSTFAATPKPTRSIREKLAQETGLNMRVIQVWFQNRRSKERRLKQQGVTQQTSSQNRSSRSHRKSRTNRLDSGDSLDENQSLNTSHLHDFQPQDISSQVPQSPSQYVHSGPQPYNNNSFYSKSDSISDVITSISTGNEIASTGYGGQTLAVTSLHGNSSPSSTLNSSEHFSQRLNNKIGSSQSPNTLMNHTSTEVW